MKWDIYLIEESFSDKIFSRLIRYNVSSFYNNYESKNNSVFELQRLRIQEQFNSIVIIRRGGGSGSGCHKKRLGLWEEKEERYGIRLLGIWVRVRGRA